MKLKDILLKHLIKSKIKFLLILLFNCSYSQQNIELKLIYGNVLFGINTDSLPRTGVLNVELGDLKYDINIESDSLKRLKKYESKYLSFSIKYYKDSIVKKIYNFDKRYFNVIKSDKQYIKEVYFLDDNYILLMKQYEISSGNLLSVFKYNRYKAGFYRIIEYSDGFESWGNIFLLDKKDNIKSWHEEFNLNLKEVFKEDSSKIIHTIFRDKKIYQKINKEGNVIILYNYLNNEEVGSIKINKCPR